MRRATGRSHALHAAGRQSLPSNSILNIRARERGQKRKGHNQTPDRPVHGTHDWSNRGDKVVSVREAEAGPGWGLASWPRSTGGVVGQRSR